MKKKSSRFNKKLFSYVALIAFCILVFGVMLYNNIARKQQSKLDIKSRYTYTIRINNEGNVIGEDETAVIDSEEVSDFKNINICKVAESWLKGYVDQYRQRFVPTSKAITSLNITSSRLLNSESNTVLLSFSIKPVNVESDFFSSWQGFIDEDLLICEWVISFYIDNNFDNTATIYVTSSMSSEDYGISQYYASQAADAKQEEASNPNKDALAEYQIKDNTLFVSYDGEKNILVPVSSSYLPLVDNSTSTLKEGSYMITTEKTAFVYGGRNVSGSKIPLTIVYSDDKGDNWTTCELDKIYTADYYYVHFFDVNNGVIICGYARNDTNESSRIYKTNDGGETWDTVGSGPTTNIMKGVIFITPDVGFFCFDYVTGMDSNLYKTSDGGVTFSKVILTEQELDSSASKGESNQQLTWNDVYKECLVPVVNSSGTITVYLTQGKNGVYNDGKTAAKYQSSDNGVSWKYMGQLEIQ